MFPVPGHASLALLCHRYLVGSLKYSPELVAVLAGAFLPDLIDKPLNDVFHITPYGRYAMHNILSVLVCGGLVWWFFGRSIAISYSAGHGSHLLGDADYCPWLLPFKQYDFPQGINTLDLLSQPGRILFPSWIIMETILLGLVLFLYTRYAKKTSVQVAVVTAIIALAVYRITREKPDYAILEGQ